MPDEIRVLSIQDREDDLNSPQYVVNEGEAVHYIPHSRLRCWEATVGSLNDEATATHCQLLKQKVDKRADRARIKKLEGENTQLLAKVGDLMPGC